MKTLYKAGLLALLLGGTSSIATVASADDLGGATFNTSSRNSGQEIWVSRTDSVPSRGWSIFETSAGSGYGRVVAAPVAREWKPRPLQLDCAVEGSGYLEFLLQAKRAQCIPDPVNPDPAAPLVMDPLALREGVARRAFSLTVWAKPTPSMQHPGLATLVNLPTYYKTGFTTDGFGPGEVHQVDPVAVLGMNVKVRPRVIEYVYNFGDGVMSGPTRSSGGVWPDGDITHTYRKPGLYPVRIDVTYTADISLDDGPFEPVGETVTVTGSTVSLTVKEARTRLIKD